jgi:hypothetical protein
MSSKGLSESKNCSKFHSPRLLKNFTSQDFHSKASKELKSSTPCLKNSENASPDLYKFSADSFGLKPQVSEESYVSRSNNEQDAFEPNLIRNESKISKFSQDVKIWMNEFQDNYSNCESFG